VPWLYGVLQNFGGTLMLGFSVDVMNTGAPEDPSAAPGVAAQFASHDGGVGVGAFPEVRSIVRCSVRTDDCVVSAQQSGSAIAMAARSPRFGEPSIRVCGRAYGWSCLGTTKSPF